jgi:putative endonuclease
MQRFYVYIMTNRRRTLYVGTTNDLARRVREHKQKTRRGFTRKYDLKMLVWFDEFYSAIQAIEAEKKIKGWIRSKKVALIESRNPGWHDLASTLLDAASLNAPSLHEPFLKCLDHHSEPFAPLRVCEESRSIL